MFNKALNGVTAIIFTMMIFLSGCGGGASAPMKATPTGSVSMNIAWDGSTTVPSSVAKINIAITSPGTSTWIQTLPASSWGGGTLDNVPAAGSATVLVTALDIANNTIYQGVVKNQVVKSGQTSSVGTISMQGITPVTHTISGTVTSSDTGVVLSGATATLQLPDSSSMTAQTDANGVFLFTGIPNGSYSIAVSMPGFVMTASRTVDVSGVNVGDVNFTATPTSPAIYTISGQVTSNGAGLSGVTIVATGSGLADVVTGSDGTFTFTHVRNGSYTITASKPGYVTSSLPVVVNSADVSNVNFAAAVVTSITLGTPVADVHRIQGTPTFIDNHGTYELHYYGADYFTVSIPARTVTAWSNTKGTLIVNMAYLPDPTGLSTISLGDTWNDMIRVQGTPTVIQNNGTSAIYQYGNDSFTLSTASNLVYTVNGWNNNDGTLKVKMRYGPTTDATRVTLRSSWDDMIKIQGTPTVIQNSGTTAIYYYDRDCFYLSTPTNRVYTVTGWSNIYGTLLVEMQAVSPTGKKAVAIGSSLDDVINVQKVTPVTIRNYGYYTNIYYGTAYYSVSVPENTVIGWDNIKSALLVDMTLFTNHTPATTFDFYSSLDDLISAQGTPSKIVNRGTLATYYYKSDSVDITIPGNRVYAWSNKNSTLNTLMTYDTSKVTTDPFIHIGSSWDDVIRIQGTPTEVKNSGTSFTFYYGIDYINISVAIPERTVTAWYNPDGKLKVN